MSIQFEFNNNELKCMFEKDIVASAIGEMRESLNFKLTTEQNWENMVLDMEKVEKIDSLGINLIVWLFRMTKSGDKSFKIVGCNEQIMKVFLLFRLQEQFPIEPFKKN